MHIVIKQYRVIYILIVAFFLWLGYDAWEWYKGNYSMMSEASTAGFISIFLAVIAILKFVLENLRQDNEHDDKHDG